MRFQPFDRFAAGHKWIAWTVLAAFGLALPIAAQEELETEKKLRTVIKATQHIDVAEAESVLGLLGVHFALKPDQNLIVLRGENYAIETALKVIEALDVPRPSIDLNLFVLSASKEGRADVPEALQGAVAQLKNAFGYSGFHVLDSVMLRVLEGRQGGASGAIRLGEDPNRTGYRFGFDKITLAPGAGERDRNIRIKNLKFEVNGHIAGTYRAALMTDVQVREGQKAVIGSSTPQGVGETLIVIVEGTAPPDPSWKAE